MKCETAYSSMIRDQVTAPAIVKLVKASSSAETTGQRKRPKQRSLWSSYQLGGNTFVCVVRLLVRMGICVSRAEKESRLPSSRDKLDGDRGSDGAKCKGGLSSRWP